jgi:hypothetical protein
MVPKPRPFTDKYVLFIYLLVWLVVFCFLVPILISIATSIFLFNVCYIHGVYDLIILLQGVNSFSAITAAIEIFSSDEPNFSEFSARLTRTIDPKFIKDKIALPFIRSFFYVNFLSFFYICLPLSLVLFYISVPFIGFPLLFLIILTLLFCQCFIL